MMNEHRVCIPLDAEGAVHGRMGQARSVVTFRLSDAGVSEWTEHVVDWDNDYGLKVYGVHHPRVIRFLKRHDVDLVLADEVCESLQHTFEVMGIEVRSSVDADPRVAADLAAAAA